MKKISFVIALSFTIFIGCYHIVSAQKKSKSQKAAINLQTALVLKENWKIQLGDSLNWAKPDYQDKHWQTTQIGKNWEQIGIGKHRGFAWYRCQVKVPKSLQQDDFFKATQQLVLALGQIDDVDETYWNGKLIGSTGKISPFEGKRGVKRIYNIPTNEVKWDSENTIAIRVFNPNDNRGGLYTQTPALHAHFFEKLSQDSIYYDQENGIYHTEKNTANLTFSIKTNEKLPTFSATLCQYIISDKYQKPDTLFKTQKNITLAPQQWHSDAIAHTFKEPGYVKAGWTLKVGNHILKEKNYRIGYLPEQVKSANNEPADFHDFWKNSKKQLAEIVPNYQLQRIDSLCNEKTDVFVVSMQSWDNLIVKGYYTRPKNLTNFPAILELPWYTGGLPPRLDAPDFAVFTLHVRGHGMSTQTFNPGFAIPGFLQYNIENKDLYTYRGVMLDCKRALDFLFAQKDIDSTKIAVMGISQGGGLALAATALDNRVAYCVSSVPFLSNYPIYFETVNWPRQEFEDYIKKANSNITMDKVLQTLAYYDVKNLSQWIKCPVHFFIGLQDDVCPPIINFAAYNAIKSPKTYTVQAKKGHDGGGNTLMLEKIKAFFKL